MIYQGIPSPPNSPPLAAHASAKYNNAGRARRGGAADTIRHGSESSMCEIMRSVFLGEGSQHCEDLLVMGAHCDSNNNDYGVKMDGYPAHLMDAPEPHALRTDTGVVSDWIEMWDYVGGIRFRGFVADKGDEKAMFVFFDQSVVAGDLKAG
jgi:hypothetical protein